MFQHILIDAGHGGPAIGPNGIGAPGMNGNEKPNEADINLQVAKMLENMLLNQLATVSMTRTEDIHVDNSDRADMINYASPDAAVSIHFNSNKYSFVQGTSTLYYRPWVSYCLAAYLQNELLKQGYLDFAIKRRSGLEILNSVNPNLNIPLALVEPLYISNVDGWNKMTFGGGVIGAQNIATHISNGLIHFFDQTVTFPPKASLGYELTNFALKLVFALGNEKNTTYYLYSTNDPNQELADWDLETSGFSTSWETTISETKKFYRLKCVSGNEESLSEILEVFKFDCKKGINWITIPDLNGNLCSGSDMTSAKDLMNKFSDIESVSKWDNEEQGWITALKTRRGVVNDFFLDEKHSYSINANNDFSFISVGYFEDNAVFYLKPGINFITLPLNKSNLFNTTLFGNNIVNCDYILEWDPLKELSRISTNFNHQHGWDFPFNTVASNPYMVHVNVNQIWPNDNKFTLEINNSGNSYKKTKKTRELVYLTPNTPRKIMCKIIDENLNSLSNTDLSDFSLKAYITTRPNDFQEPIRNADCFFSLYEENLVSQINLGNFIDQWQPNDSIFIEVTQISTGKMGNITVALDNSYNGIEIGFERNEPIKVTNLKENIENNDYILSQNYPNPFNPITTISYSLPIDQFVNIKVFNIMGKEVANLVNGNVKAGIHSVEFNGNNFASGEYFYKIETKGFSKIRRMLLIK